MVRIHVAPLPKLVLCALIGATLFGGTAGCSNETPPGRSPPGGRACTQIGCGLGLSILLPELPAQSQGPITVRHCLDGNCDEKSYPGPADVPGFLEMQASQQTVSVSVEVNGSREMLAQLHETKVTLNPTRPNGPECPPVCYQGEVRVPAIKT